MADVLISNLPTYTASTVTGTYFIINNSGNTTTFKATREQFVPVGFGTGTCSLVGGASNSVAGSCSAALSGKGNTITSGGAYSFVGSGTGNTISNIGSSVVGGSGNTASGLYSYVGGGRANTNSGSHAGISSGQNNCVGNGFSYVGGGAFNCVSGGYSAVLGGYNNNVTGQCTAAFGTGISASADNTFYVNNLCALTNVNTSQVNTNGVTISSFVSGCAVCVTVGGAFTTYTPSGGGGGGPMSTGSGTCSIVGNCALNGSGLVCDYTFVGGGCFNYGSGCFSFIGGGQCNYVGACHQVINGGRNNCLSSCSPYSTIGGGFYNSPSGGFSPSVGSVISGGVGNGTTGGTFDAFTCFTWSQNPSPCSIGTFSFIGGGFQNNTLGGVSVTVGGCNNANYGCASFIGGGWNNSLNGYCNVLVGGLCNTMVCNGFANVLSGGYNNKMVNGSYHFMGAGQCNVIGCCNMSACYNNVIGGTKAYVDGQFGFIGNSADCGVFGSCSNTIACGTYGSTILNGACNSVSGSFSPGCYNFYSTILGGCSNNASCCFNLMYGCGNYAMGNYTNVIGCGIMGSASCTTYFNNVCVCGTLSKVSGSFKIPHPDPNKTNKFLQHSFVEAPTAGENIYRYSVSTTNCSASIELPDYYKFLNENDQVFVTPKNHFGSAYGIVNQEQTCVSFCSNCDGEYNVLIIGTRKDKEARKYWKGTEVNEVQE